MESVLTSIKKILGITEEYEHFDPEIIMHINSVFMILDQLGVGPSGGFTIKDKTNTWSEFISDQEKIEAVKSYMGLKVKLLFDPPTGAVLESTNRMIEEFEWRLNLAVDTWTTSETDNPGGGGDIDITDLDYRQLKNLPKINGETLVTNYDEKDPNVKEITETDVETIWNEVFGDTAEEGS